VQRQANDFLRRIEHGNPAVLELAGVLGFEQQVEAVERHIRQALFHRLDIQPSPSVPQV
jgi:hypothetical protein